VGVLVGADWGVQVALGSAQQPGSMVWDWGLPEPIVLPNGVRWIMPVSRVGEDFVLWSFFS
jgi:hypothetical protein